MSPTLHQQVAMTALNKMMRSSFFSICAINDAGLALGVEPRQHPSYDLLAPLHCVDWRAMPDQVRKAIPGLIMDCLSIEACQFEPKGETVADARMLVLQQAVDPPKPFIKRIFARLAA